MKSIAYQITNQNMMMCGCGIMMMMNTVSFPRINISAK
ncbi:CO dehydrogenase/acetyl-CoA synthase delta subunit [Aequitasia blattaphilus]